MRSWWLALGILPLLGACVLATDFDALTAGVNDAAAVDGPESLVEASAETGTVPACDAGPSFVADPSNCGACGHDCVGGDCLEGTCQPVVLAAGVDGIANLRADGDALYFGATIDEGLLRVPKAGGAVVTVTTGASVYEMAFNASAIFYTGDAELRRLGRGGAIETVLSINQNVLSVTASNDSVYWCDYANENLGAGALYRRRDDGGAVATLANGLTGCETLALVGTDVVYGQHGDANAGVWKVSQSGGTPTRLSRSPARRIVVDDAFAYFISFDSEQVRRVGLDGTGEALLGGATGATVAAGNIAIDARYVYWTVNRNAGASGGIYRAPKTGGTTTTLLGNRPRPVGLVVDDRAIYWTEEETGKVLKVAK